MNPVEVGPGDVVGFGVQAVLDDAVVGVELVALSVLDTVLGRG